MINQHGFNNGDTVLYQGSGIAGLTGGQTYVVKVLDDHTIQLESSFTGGVTFTQGKNGSPDTLTLDNGTNWATYGFPERSANQRDRRINQRQ